jgi:hypothetical protein
MGEAEMELLREIYSYWAKGDFRPTHFVQPDLELVYGSDFMEEGSYKGLAEVSVGWRVWLSGWKHWSASATEYIPVGDRVLVFIDVHGVAKTSGVEMERMSANVWEFRDGLASKITLYARRETALHDLGLDAA